MVSKKRNQPEPDTSEDEDVATSNNDTAVEERRIKRIRTGGSEGIDPALEAVFADRPAESTTVFANDSSADDSNSQSAQPLKISRSRSTSRPLPQIIENNSEDAGSEDSSSDAQRPIGSFKPLGRRSAIMNRPFSSDGEKMPDDMNFRRQFVRENYNGLEIPNLPKSANGLHRSGNEVFEESFATDDEDEFDVWAAPTHSPAMTRKLLRDLRSFGTAQSTFNQTPMSKDKSQVSYSMEREVDAKILMSLQAGKQKGGTASSSRPSTNKSHKPFRINIPSSGSYTELVLTHGPLLESAHALVKYAEDNPSCRLPTGAEMKALLAEFNVREPAEIISAAASSSSEARPDTITSDHRRIVQQPLEPESGVLNNEMSVDHASDHRRIDQQTLDLKSGTLNNEMSVDQDAEEAGEVPTEVPEPRTPTPHTPQQPQAQESRSWFAGIATVAKVATTPFTTLFGRRSQSAETPTTNGAPVVGDASNAHLIPQTSDFAFQATPSHPRNRGQHIPQTEPRQRSCIKSTTRPQTESKRVRFHSPIAKRGALTPEQVAEIHRKQDADRNRRERQKLRASLQASVEDADELHANQSVQSARVGEKRKQRHPDPNDPNFNHRGHFVCPSEFYSSESDEDTEIDAETTDGGSTPFSSNQPPHPSPFGTSIRPDRYNGTLFAQPANVQANLDEGKHPLAPRPSTPSLQASTGNFGSVEELPSQQSTKIGSWKISEREQREIDRLFGHFSKPSAPAPEATFAANSGGLFGRITAPAGDSRIGILAGGAHMLEPATSEPAPVPTEADEHAGLFGRITAPAGNSQIATSVAGAHTPEPTPEPTPAVERGGLFGRITAPTGDSRIGTFAAGAHTLEPAAPTGDSQIATFVGGAHTPESATSEATSEPTPALECGRTFGFSYTDEYSGSEEESFDENEDATQPDVQHTSENAPGDATRTPLQPSTWTQTPPPKPKPSNAQLPQILAQPSAAELAKAKAEKYKPVVPSKLSQSTLMTPPHNDKENRIPEAQATESVEELKAAWQADVEKDRSRFDPEVLRAVDSSMEIPASFFDLRAVYPFDSEVLDEVMKAPMIGDA
jgi:hypothetical protein